MNDLNDPEANGTARENDPEDLGLEISDLPPSERRHYMLIKLVALARRLRAAFSPLKHAGAPGQDVPAPSRLTRKQSRARIGQTLTALGLCATLLLLFIGNVPGLRTRVLGLFSPPAPTPTPAFTGYFSSSQHNVPIIVERRTGLPNIPAQGSPGPLPATCPQASMLQFFLTPLDPPGLGGGPIWFTGFVGPTAALVDLQPLGTSLTHPPGGIVGWYESLAVFIQKGFTGTIILQGASQNTENSLLFASSGSLNFNSAIALSLRDFPNQQDALNGSWEMTSINIFVPMSGCYALQASWSGKGGWSHYFAAGD